MQILSAPILPVSESVMDAEAALVETLVRLERLQLQALTGGFYDADDYDTAIIAYRHARMVAEDARARWMAADRPQYDVA
jgi:hypothetical protein